jgi:hypothetical protein
MGLPQSNQDENLKLAELVPSTVILTYRKYLVNLPICFLKVSAINMVFTEKKT